MYNQSSDVPRVDDKGNKTFQPVHDGALLGFSYDHSALTDTYPDFPCPPLSPEGKQAPKTGYFLTLYPNLYLAVMPTMVEIGIGLPDSPDETIDMRGYYCHKSAAADPALIKAFDDFADLFAEASEEDSTVVAAIQRARYSRFAGNSSFLRSGMSRIIILPGWCWMILLKASSNPCRSGRYQSYGKVLRAIETGTGKRNRCSADFKRICEVY